MTPGYPWAGLDPNTFSEFPSPRFPVFFLFGGGCSTHGSSSGSKNSPYKFFLRKNLLKNGLTTLHLFGPVKNRQVDHQ